MLLAGSKCETAGRLPKSGILHEAQTTMRIYQIVLSQLKTKRDLSKQIEKRQLQLPVAISLPTTINETNRLLRISQRTVRKLARKAYDLKKQQRDEKVAALVNAEPGSVKEKILQRIERAEHTKAMFLRLPSIKPKPSGGISLVKVPTDLPNKPKEAKEWRTVTEPDEIEQLIMERQKVHFGQATPTPFANEPLKSTFNWTGTSPEVQVVLKGDYVPSNTVDSQSNRILQSCTRKMPPVSSSIPLDAMKNKYRSWKETTSTSPSGRHLGHKHALLKPLTNSNNWTRHETKYGEYTI